MTMMGGPLQVGHGRHDLPLHKYRHSSLTFSQCKQRASRSLSLNHFFCCFFLTSHFINSSCCCSFCSIHHSTSRSSFWSFCCHLSLVETTFVENGTRVTLANIAKGLAEARGAIRLDLPLLGNLFSYRGQGADTEVTEGHDTVPHTIGTPNVIRSFFEGQAGAERGVAAQTNIVSAGTRSLLPSSRGSS